LSGTDQRRAMTNGSGLIPERVRGKMLWFNEAKNVGLISADEERLPVEGRAFQDEPPRGPCSGLVVEFEIEAGADGPQAARVRVVPETVPRRARRRGSR
jgi:cold shock CspA family protein